MEKSVWNSEYIGDELLWGKMHFSKKGLLAFIFESERMSQIITAYIWSDVYY